MDKFRIEEDYLGEIAIPSNVYWGANTQRALNNFHVTNRFVNVRLINALSMVKKACAQANFEIGFLDSKKNNAISQACDEIIEGKFSTQFPVDALQGGAGTSTNMNINEVIANRAIEILGGKRGNYSIVHPIEDVNLHQSTNDVYPTALKIAVIYALRDLSGAIAFLQGEFQKKEKEFSEIVKTGRTEMQDAVPMTLGMEFSAFAEAVSRDRWRTFKAEERIRLVNIGGTAVGTGLTAPKKYIFLVIEKLRDITSLGIARGENTVDQTANGDAFVEVSAILKANASNIIKISNDLRLLNMLKEINLPSIQTGSSIMPGKINPVICESSIQAGLKVMTNDSLISESVSRATLQINEFMPLLADTILESIDILLNTNLMLKDYVSNILPCKENCENNLHNSVSIITALLPYIGYERAESLLKEYKNTDKKQTIKEFLCIKLDKDLVERVLDPYVVSALGYNHEKNP